MARVTPTQSLTLGPISQSVKKRSSLKQWRTIKRKARKSGFQLEDFLDQSVPQALKARTRPGIRREAARTMRKVYAPAELELTQQEAKVKAVDEKRARDNQFYTQWLEGRSSQMREAAKQADSTLRDTQGQIADDAAAHAGAARQEMMQAAASVPGTVSDPQQATAFDTSASDRYNADLIASQRDATNRAIGTAEQRQATVDASNFAFMAASEAKRQGDTWAKLGELGDEKQKLQLSKAADAAQEVARLFDQEITKAQSNREYKTVAQKLGVDLANIEQDDRASQRSARQRELDRKARNKQARADLRLKRDQQAFEQGLSEAELAIKQGNLDLGWYRATHPSKGKAGAKDPSKPGSGASPQERFEYGYALVTTSVRQGKPTKEGQFPNKPYDADWVAKNYKTVVNQLIAKGKYKRSMAESIVNAFIRRNGSNPGNYQQYTPKGYRGPN